ncbi:ABC-2 family transporter protein, partial [Ruminococcaceae bacterium OttesenSCG-928-L11]|nr:ABC-2 family transporter protein [Ruminococcaceae bacterium OttesenSCG-928-L11]
MDKKTRFFHFFRLLGIHAKLDLAWILRDFKTVLLMEISDILSNLSSAAGMFLLAARFDGIGDMSTYEILFMMGYIVLLNGVFITFCAQNNGHISRIIGRGQLEHHFIQPVALSTQLFTMGFAPFTALPTVLSGLALIGISLHRLALRPQWWWILALLASILLSFAMQLIQSYLYSTAAFYSPVAAEEISTSILESLSELSR